MGLVAPSSAGGSLIVRKNYTTALKRTVFLKIDLPFDFRHAIRSESVLRSVRREMHRAENRSKLHCLRKSHKTFSQNYFEDC